MNYHTLTKIGFNSIQQPFQRSTSGNNDYFEDFLTNDFEELDSSNVTGWGQGELQIPKGRLELVGNYNTTGFANDVEIKGNHAFIADGMDGLKVINVSNPSSPNLVTSYDTLNAVTLAISGNTTILADYVGGYDVFNITDPSLLERLDYSGSNDIFDIFVRGDLAYCATNFPPGLPSLIIYNISNPNSLGEVGTYFGDKSTRAIADGSNIYLGTEGGLYILDSTNLNTPTYLTDTGLGGKVTGLVMHKQNLIATIENGGFYILNVSDPSYAIVFVKYEPIAGSTLGAYVDGDYLFVLNDLQGVLVYDISDHLNPQLVTSYKPIGVPQGMALSGNYVYLATGNQGLEILQLRDSWQTNLISLQDTPGDAFNVLVNGNYTYVADSSKGIQIFNTVDPQNPTLIGNYTTPGNAYNLAIQGKLAYIADGSNGMLIINVSDPSIPTFVGSYATYGNTRDIIVDGDTVYLADFSNGLLVFDVSDPQNPSPIGQYDTSGLAYNLDQIGNTMFLADYDNGLLILNISNRFSPVIIGDYFTSGVATNVKVNDNIVYLQVSNQLMIIDVSNLNNPKLIGSFISPNLIVDLKIDGNILYVGGGSNGVMILDVSDKSNPIQVENYITNSYANGVDFNGDYLHVAYGTSGLVTLRKWLPRFELYPYPAVSQSINIFSTPQDTYLTSATLVGTSDIQEGTSLFYYLSPDGGLNWEQVLSGVTHGFVNPGSHLKWKVILEVSDTRHTPSLMNLEINYHYFSSPSLREPSNQLITINTTPSFSWNVVDDESMYLFELDTSINFDSENLQKIEVNAPNYLPSSDLSHGVWFWRVAVLDSGGIGPFSMTRILVIIQTESISPSGDVVTATVTTTVNDNSNNITITTTANKSNSNGVPFLFISSTIGCFTIYGIYRKSMKR